VSGSSRGGFSGGGGRGGGRGGRGGGHSSGGHSSGGFFGNPFIFLGGGGRSYGGRYGHNSGRGPGCSAIIAIAIVLILIIVILALVQTRSSSVPASTYQREPLEKNVALETAYLKDELHWISDVSGVERSMRHFYDKTGVRPYLWITDSVGGKSFASDDEIRAALETLYAEEITDQGHIVILFLEPSDSNYDIYYLTGALAQTVLDQEACDILMDYFIRYYESGYDDNEYFSKVFTDAADRIMTKTMPVSLILIFMIGGLIALICVCLFIVTMVKKSNERKRLNAEILNTPIDGDDAIDIEDEADKAAKKYD
jgi:hypothetical protein